MESRYGPGWVRAECPDKRGGGEGNDCVHLALATRYIREEFERERGVPLLEGTTHVARDEHGNWLQLTESEAWAFVRGAKAGDFDGLFGTPPNATPDADIPAGDSPLARIDVIVGNAKTLDEDQTARIRGVLLDGQSAADLSAPGSPVEGWPEKHMLEAAFGLLCSAAPHAVLGDTQAGEWSRAFERWRDAYNEMVRRQKSDTWSCSA